MSAFKNVISTAVNKLYSLHKRYDDAEVFCIDLFKILDNEEIEVGNGEPDGYTGSRETPCVQVPVEISTQTEEPPKPAPAPAPKPAPKPKLTKEEKEAEKKAKEEAKVAAAAKKEAEKKAKEEAAAAAKAAKEAKAAAPKPEVKKPELNLPKLNPTQNKLFKKVAGEYNGSDHTIQKAFVDSMNKLSHDEFDSKKMEDHMKEFVSKLPVEVPATTEEECVVVDYKGKEYSVSNNGTVYEETILADGEPVYRKVGVVGMAEFVDLKIPEDE
jgi:flagellar biosynthesis GTPase FlhF